MAAVDLEGAPARRRTPASAAYGAGVPRRRETIDDLISVAREPRPWVARRLGDDRIFRGRLQPGTAALPTRDAPAGRRAVTFGLASRPIVLRSVGVAHPIPAGAPWVVLAGSEWRITVAEPTDLRLVHGHGIDPDLVDATVIGSRPTRFRSREAQIVRTAITSATPVWIDATARTVLDLADGPQPDWREVGSRTDAGVRDSELISAFVLMASWAFEQHRAGEDPRRAAVLQHVEAHLADPTMNTASIASRLKISRRTLQTMFEPRGGLAAYIRRQRLAAVLRLLTADPGLPDLDAVAAMTGLGSRRTLERSMRQVYGLTPRQARAHVVAGHDLRERTTDAFEEAS
ncbi:MAG: helix-turn-helix domain-containing protein [Marmoricola sp.]